MARTQDQLYQAITDRIVAALESGTAPWIKPWKADGTASASLPHNACTRRAYHGINTLILWGAQHAMGYASAQWLTFKQATERSGHVRAGEKGTEIVFWKFLNRDVKDGAGNPVRGDDGAVLQRKVPMLRTYYVFNVAQCEGLELPAARKVRPEIDPTTIDALADTIGARIQWGGDRACYVPAFDQINMPRRAAFRTLDAYHGTLLHEITHWTGHESRCARSLVGRFGSEAYAAEELIAEMGSAFLCASLGVNLEGLQHADYIGSWIKVLKSDNRAIFTAAKAAQVACDWVLAAAGIGESDADQDDDSAELPIAA